LEKQEEKLEYRAKNNPDYLWISGSHLYGMNTKDSDLDLRGFVQPGLDYMIGIKEFKSIEFKEDDHKVYSVKHFLELALKGDPQVTESFFCPEKNIVKCSELGKEVMKLKDDLISNAIYGRIMGYSTGEWRKAMAIQVVPKKWKKEKHEVINDIRNMWKPDKETMDSIIKSLEDLDEMEVVSSVAQLGKKRKADIEEYGYCRKSAAHSIRLVRQLTELMLEGTMTFPRPEADFLLAIREGKYIKTDLELIHDDVVEVAEAARDRSVLPDKPNEKKVWDTYFKLTIDTIAHFICKDD